MEETDYGDALKEPQGAADKGGGGIEDALAVPEAKGAQGDGEPSQPMPTDAPAVPQAKEASGGVDGALAKQFAASLDSALGSIKEKTRSSGLENTYSSLLDSFKQQRQGELMKDLKPAEPKPAEPPKPRYAVSKQKKDAWGGDGDDDSTFADVNGVSFYVGKGDHTGDKDIEKRLDDVSSMQDRMQKLYDSLD